MTPAEIELLLCCSRTEIDSDMQARVQAILRAGDVNWAAVVAAAEWHGIGPLLYHNLHALGINLPAQPQERLAYSTRQITYHNFYLMSELQRLLNLLEAEHIRAIPYKGAILATVTYGNVALRSFGDIDILVDNTDLEKAKALMFSQSYQPRPDASDPLPGKEAKSRGYQGYTLIKDNGQATVDLQDRFGIRFSSFMRGFADLWANRIEVEIGGKLISTLSPEDNLMVLCAHGTQHRWLKLKWVCDINELLRVYPAMDWDKVLERAKAMRTERILYIGLLLAHDYMGTSLPQPILELAQRDSAARSVAARTYYWLFHSPATLYELIRKLGFDFTYDLSVRAQLSNKIAHTGFFIDRRVSPKSADKAVIALPRALSFLYYVVRPLRILVRYTKGDLAR